MAKHQEQHTQDHHENRHRDEDLKNGEAAGVAFAGRPEHPSALKNSQRGKS